MKRLIDWFIPAAQVELGVPERARQRKLVSFLFVLLAAVTASGLAHLSRENWLTLAGSGIILGVVLLALAALRRGAAAWVVTCVVLIVGICVAAVMAVGAVEGGIQALFGITLAPLLALPIGGRRAGWAMLAVSWLAIFVGLLGIEYHWVTPFMSFGSPFETRITGVTFVLVTSFLLARAYETETEASIRALEEKNQALLEAQAAALGASRAKGEFLATMSHELRTPLNGVTGMAALLVDESDPKRVKEGLRIIQQSADTLLKVITDVLDFSKIESNQLELEAVPVSVAHELRVVAELFEGAAAERWNDLQLELDPGVPAWLTGDPTRLRQVVSNLVANAVKFTSRGLVKVAARARDGQLVIEVSDSGIGMTPEVRERLFNPFVQAEASTTRRFGGTGLGLVISRRLVEAMRGTLEVRSEPRQGSTFVVTMPFAIAAAPSVPEARLSVAATKRSVLVVEDNFVNQVVVLRLLEKLGHAVTVAGDGEEGLARLAKDHFDVVLMDCHMPVMDGYEATRQLRARGDRTPVFALTAAVTTEDREQCLRAGMTGVLSKPLRIERLSEVLQGLPAPLGAG